jgi:hypothetical protein
MLLEHLPKLDLQKELSTAELKEPSWMVFLSELVLAAAMELL